MRKYKTSRKGYKMMVWFSQYGYYLCRYVNQITKELI